eukprot:CAMPEP_0185750718 /NCGR_PEP_ID=MMETSP1174-20130828/9486_1 /TAXON_ID=35687 /ORGANISM="Dictyocha speculum, Strain CCMP1381" /LENGTH=140 /DNA_ID=CAMNT_0028427355 /DNA_START=91 /DNA_END=513 /DNA_ORIENTATION=+
MAEQQRRSTALLPPVMLVVLCTLAATGLFVQQQREISKQQAQINMLLDHKVVNALLTASSDPASPDTEAPNVPNDAGLRGSTNIFQDTRKLEGGPASNQEVEFLRQENRKLKEQNEKLLTHCQVISVDTALAKEGDAAYS